MNKKDAAPRLLSSHTLLASRSRAPLVLSRVRSTMMASYRNPNKKQELSAYHPNAIRNRLPVVFKDAAVPGKRFCKPRNEHTYECAPRRLRTLTSRDPSARCFSAPLCPHTLRCSLF